MINLFTHKRLLNAAYRGSTHPLIFDLFYYNGVNNPIKKYYQLVENENQADAYIFPVDYSAINKKGLKSDFKKLYQLATLHKKKLLVYTAGDYGKTFNDINIITFRNAGFKSKNDPQTQVMPAFMNDPIDDGTVTFKTHPLHKLPQISFTGFATVSLSNLIEVFLLIFKGNLFTLLGRHERDFQSFYNPFRKRFRYLKSLEKDNQVETEFIYRERYRAGAVTQAQRDKSTKEFFENLNNHPYTFCMRGAGNFSVRFYESLACGRIPVFIDTDSSLPLENLIDWNQHICKISQKTNLGEQIRKFHASFNEDTFRKIQHANRKLYEDFLKRQAYFCKLHDTLKALL